MKDQNVILCVDSAQNAATALPWARHFAEHLNHKGIIALHVGEPTAPQWLQQLEIPYISMHGQWSTAIEGLPTVFNGILAVAACDPEAPRTSIANPHTLLRAFRNSKIAYLAVNRHSLLTVSQSVLTLTHRSEGKEKLVWASYLARFLNSEITIASPDYRDADLRWRLGNNLIFADKIFNPLNITYNRHTLPSTTHVDRASIDDLHPNLLIARTTDTRDRDFLDWLAPLPEYRLLTHPSHTPLLFLNPRDDLYILCD